MARSVSVHSRIMRIRVAWLAAHTASSDCRVGVVHLGVTCFFAAVFFLLLTICSERVCIHEYFEQQLEADARQPPNRDEFPAPPAHTVISVCFLEWTCSSRPH
jgi:hypothetical protein